MITLLSAKQCQKKQEKKNTQGQADLPSVLSSCHLSGTVSASSFLSGPSQNPAGLSTLNRKRKEIGEQCSGGVLPRGTVKWVTLTVSERRERAWKCRHCADLKRKGHLYGWRALWAHYQQPCASLIPIGELYITAQRLHSFLLIIRHIKQLTESTSFDKGVGGGAGLTGFTQWSYRLVTD